MSSHLIKIMYLNIIVYGFCVGGGWIAYSKILLI